MKLTFALAGFALMMFLFAFFVQKYINNPLTNRSFERFLIPVKPLLVAKSHALLRSPSINIIN
ncbi:Uncharacterised protein [Avibacterium paragallinarum]|uniref:Uncharacterized protein n=1 Tax=Avibacterium paragallinarum TaxID=728 RepID=A0A380X264_AVIPA|nr:Uncharacterised protein [Avibacterium paragallinarum]